MMAAGEQVAWADGIRRARRRELLLPLLLLVAVTTGFGLLMGREGPWVWPFLGGMWLVLAAANGVLYLRSARFGRSDRHRVQYAVQAHLDPGAGLREKAERYSRQRHRDRWFLSFELAVLVLFIVTISPWDDTGRAWLGATLVVVPYLVRFIDSWHLGAAGRRWLENPPGPSRD